MPKSKAMKLVGFQVFNNKDGYYCEVIVVSPNGEREKITEKGTYVDRGTYFEFDTNEGKYDQKFRWMETSWLCISPTCRRGSNSHL